MDIITTLIVTVTVIILILEIILGIVTRASFEKDKEEFELRHNKLNNGKSDIETKLDTVSEKES